MALRAAANTCPNCNYIDPSRAKPVVGVDPWKLPCRRAVVDYVASLSLETREWLIALYVDQEFKLLAVDTIARGTASECPINAGTIICHGKRVGATGFFLVHNHPSGDSRPSKADRRATSRLARLSSEFDLHLIEHFVIGSRWMETVMLG